MAFAILCDARMGQGSGIEVLALVDRSKTKRLWWTSDNTAIILDYSKRSAADFAVSRLHMNNARVVTIAEARSAIKEQADHLEHLEACDSMEMGWDGHKVWS